MAEEHEIVIEVNNPSDLPENIFDGVVRTLKYPSGMTMIVGTPHDLDHVFPRETPEEFEARLEREHEENRAIIEACPALKAECEGVDPLERWLS